jgi:predicted transcriptional regulator
MKDTEQFSVRTNKELIERLDEYAKKVNVSRGKLAGQVLSMVLDEAQQLEELNVDLDEERTETKQGIVTAGEYLYALRKLTPGTFQLEVKK